MYVLPEEKKRAADAATRLGSRNLTPADLEELAQKIACVDCPGYQAAGGDV